jgi:PTS system mannose-specific IID component
MSEPVLTKKDLSKVLHRYIWARQSPFNYETMQSGGWVYAMHPAMAKLYDNDPEILTAKYRQYFRFYNTHPWMGNIIMGACLAVESTKKPDCTETAVDLRTALMGPLAGLGDSIIWVILPTVMGAIAAYQAQEGSILGWVLAEAVQLVIWIAFNRGFYIAYDRGIDFVTSRSESLNHLTSAATIVGLAVVGALTASIVNVKFGITWTVGELTQNLDDLMNAIVPHFANVVTMIIMYYLIAKKNISTGKLVLWTIVVTIILSAFNILA